MKKISSKNGDKGELAKGAEEIRKAQKEARGEKTELGPLVIPDSARPIEDILRDRVTVLDGHIGLKLAEDTPIEESLRVLDWTTQLSDHVGFMIGDVLNFGHTKWGEKYTAALNQTGRARSTLRQYASVAARIPPGQRKACLTFWHHELIVRTSEPIKLLEETAKQAEKGEPPTIQQLRETVKKLTPRKPKKPTSGKGKKRKTKPEPPPYVPDAEEQSKLDAAEDALNQAASQVTSLKMHKLVFKLDNTEKQRWLAFTEPIVDFYNAVERVTGY
jgi:hypothetical protein